MLSLWFHNESVGGPGLVALPDGRFPSWRVKELINHVTFIASALCCHRHRFARVNPRLTRDHLVDSPRRALTASLARCARRQPLGSRQPQVAYLEAVLPRYPTIRRSPAPDTSHRNQKSRKIKFGIETSTSWLGLVVRREIAQHLGALFLRERAQSAWVGQPRWRA
jgi:hypothetical protein